MNDSDFSDVLKLPRGNLLIMHWQPGNDAARFEYVQYDVDAVSRGLKFFQAAISAASKFVIDFKPTQLEVADQAELAVYGLYPDEIMQGMMTYRIISDQELNERLTRDFSLHPK